MFCLQALLRSRPSGTKESEPSSREFPALRFLIPGPLCASFEVLPESSPRSTIHRLLLLISVGFREISSLWSRRWAGCLASAGPAPALGSWEDLSTGSGVGTTGPGPPHPSGRARWPFRAGSGARSQALPEPPPSPFWRAPVVARPSGSSCDPVGRGPAPWVQVAPCWLVRGPLHR